MNPKIHKWAANIVIFFFCTKFFFNLLRIVGSTKKLCWKICTQKHKKAEQALGRSLRNLFEKQALRTLPAAVRTYNISNSCLTP